LSLAAASTAEEQVAEAIKAQNISIVHLWAPGAAIANLS
jgi:hypothetical protein